MENVNIEEIIYERKINYYETDDTILIKVIIKEYSGVRMTVSYDVRDKKTGEKVIEAETKHCFTNKELRPVSLKRYEPEFNSKIEEMIQVVE